MIYSSSHVILFATLCGTFTGCGKGAPEAKGAPGGGGGPPPVSVATVTKRVVQEFGRKPNGKCLGESDKQFQKRFDSANQLFRWMRTRPIVLT